jgi:hypothetical protein
MRALFKGKNRKGGVQTAGLGGSAHSGCVSADHDQSFFGHESAPLFKISQGGILLAL